MIEERFKKAIDRYVKQGIPTNGFLRYVLENDLRNAIGTVDKDALANLKDIVSYCYNDIPGCCWGSKDNVKKWLAEFHKVTE